MNFIPDDPDDPALITDAEFDVRVAEDFKFTGIDPMSAPNEEHKEFGGKHQTEPAEEGNEEKEFEEKHTESTENKKAAKHDMKKFFKYLIQPCSEMNFIPYDPDYPALMTDAEFDAIIAKDFKLADIDPMSAPNEEHKEFGEKHQTESAEKEKALKHVKQFFKDLIQPCNEGCLRYTDSNDPARMTYAEFDVRVAEYFKFAGIDPMSAPNEEHKEFGEKLQTESAEEAKADKKLDKYVEQYLSDLRWFNARSPDPDLTYEQELAQCKFIKEEFGLDFKPEDFLNARLENKLSMNTRSATITDKKEISFEMLNELLDQECRIQQMAHYRRQYPSEQRDTTDQQFAGVSSRSGRSLCPKHHSNDGPETNLDR